MNEDEIIVKLLIPVNSFQLSRGAEGLEPCIGTCIRKRERE